jgi:hypothetical protein
MAWEPRGRGGRYYYRTVRIDGRPKKVYIGRGEGAEDQARRDALARQQLQGERDALAAASAEVAPADRALDELTDVAGLLLHATLITAGYHLDHREWRRRRDHSSVEAHR